MGTKLGTKFARSLGHAWGTQTPLLGHPAWPPTSHQVRPEERDDQDQDREDKVTVDVLSMIEEVAVNHLVHHHDGQRD